MSADHVSLRPVLEDDLVTLDRFMLEPAVAGIYQWFGWSDPGRWRRRWAENGMLDDDGGMLMVVRDDERLGFVAWRKVATSRTSFYWNIGINLMPEARGRGYGTRAQRLLVCYLFAHTSVARIDADTEVENVAERRALEKAGFTQEGVIRRAVFRNAQWRDGVVYSILRDEVPLAELEQHI
jgi:RimJ/RimL family protein N-acetyltransferase